MTIDDIQCEVNKRLQKFNVEGVPPFIIRVVLNVIGVDYDDLSGEVSEVAATAPPAS